MKQRLKNLRNLSTTYELFIGVGLLMIIAASIKLLGWLDFLLIFSGLLLV